MTPEQQSTLEALAGRALTATEVSLAESRTDNALAASLSVGRTAPQGSYWLTDRGFVADLVKATGSTAMSGSMLTKLDAVMGADRSAQALIGRLYSDPHGLDFGDGALLAWFAAMTPAVFTEDERDAVMALREQPTPITTSQVSEILNG